MLNSSSTKKEELAALVAFKEKEVGPGSYLFDFFTPDLFTWIEDRMKSDFPPDIISTVNVLDDLNIRNGSRIREQEKENEKNVSIISDLETRLNDTLRAYNELKSQIRSLV